MISLLIVDRLMIGSNKIAVSIIKALFIVHYFGLAGLGIGDARWHFL